MCEYRDQNGVIFAVVDTTTIVEEIEQPLDEEKAKADKLPVERE